MHSPREKQSAVLCLRNPRCPMTGKNGKKSNHRHWKTWCRAQAAKAEQTGQEVIHCATAYFCIERATASRGLPEPTPSSPLPQQNLLGLQLYL